MTGINTFRWISNFRYFSFSSSFVAIIKWNELENIQSHGSLIRTPVCAIYGCLWNTHKSKIRHCSDAFNPLLFFILYFVQFWKHEEVWYFFSFHIDCLNQTCKIYVWSEYYGPCSLSISHPTKWKSGKIYAMYN